MIATIDWIEVANALGCGVIALVAIHAAVRWLEWLVGFFFEE